MVESRSLIALIVAGVVSVTSPQFVVAAADDVAPSRGTTRLQEAALEKLRTANVGNEIGVAQLRRVIEDAKREGRPVDYAEAALSFAKYFESIADKKQRYGNRRGAEADRAFLSSLVKSQIDAVQLNHGDESTMSVPSREISEVTVADGNFRSGNAPVMFLGPMGHGALGRDVSVVANVGFNMVGDDYDSYAAFQALKPGGTIDEEVITRLHRSWESLSAAKLAIAFNPTLHYMPLWALAENPEITGGTRVTALPSWSGEKLSFWQRTKVYGNFFPFSIESKTVDDLIGKYYSSLFRAPDRTLGFKVYWLMNEPTYTNLSDNSFVVAYREYLRAKYRSVVALNEAWQVGYAEFSDIPLRPRATQAYRFDLGSFQAKHVSNWIESLATRIKRERPAAIVSNKPLAASFLRPEDGIDFEREAEFLDVPGSDGKRYPRHDLYSFDWREPIMLYDFQKSVAPAKPLSDLEFHFAHEPDIDPGFVQAAFFQSYLHGVRMATFWIWGGDVEDKGAARGMSNTVWTQPRAAWATSKAALDIRRVADVVSLFPQKPEVMIYFSRASLLLSSRYRETLKVVYEAANGLDAPIGFATDKMIRGGSIATAKVLLVADAQFVERDVCEKIDEFARAGGVVLILGGAPVYDEYGKNIDKLPSFVRSDSESIVGLTAEKIAASLDAAFEKAKVYRPIRLQTLDMGNAWPIDFRCAQSKSATYCYVVGLNKRSIDARIVSRQPVKGWTDILTGERSTTSLMSVEPLSVRLVRLDFRSSAHLESKLH